jgi:lysophospholipase L1-like esterase
MSLILSALAAGEKTSPPRVAILGDSITYDGRWATRVESALRATPEFADAEIVNFGLASETVSGLSEAGHAGGRFPRPCLHERLTRILDAFKPTLVFACYGMNDGIYQPFDESRSKAFQDGILKLKTEVEKREAQIILITPPLHQIDRPDNNPKRYDTVLDAYAEALVARKTDGWKVIDIRPDLKREVAAAKGTNPKFTYAPDGIHPSDDGHRFIADSICKQLWPMLKISGTPQFSNADALKILGQRNALLKHAWLSKTHHTRPQVPAGLPLDQAEIQAAKLLLEYRAAMLKTPSDAPQKN